MNRVASVPYRRPVYERARRASPSRARSGHLRRAVVWTIIIHLAALVAVALAPVKHKPIPMAITLQIWKKPPELPPPVVKPAPPPVPIVKPAPPPVLIVKPKPVVPVKRTLPPAVKAPKPAPARQGAISERATPPKTVVPIEKPASVAPPLVPAAEPMANSIPVAAPLVKPEVPAPEAMDKAWDFLSATRGAPASGKARITGAGVVGSVSSRGYVRAPNLAFLDYGSFTTVVKSIRVEVTVGTTGTVMMARVLQPGTGDPDLDRLLQKAFAETIFNDATFPVAGAQTGVVTVNFRE